MPQITSKNVIRGVSFLRTAPDGTPQPVVSIDFPADFSTDGSGTEWATPWVYVGATDGGVTLTVGTTTSTDTVEELPTPVGIYVDTQTVTLGFTLDEDTLVNMKMAYGGGTLTTVAASSTVYGTQTLQLASSLDVIACCFEAAAPPGSTSLNTPISRRIYIPRMQSGAAVATPYLRTGKRVYPVTLTAICQQSQILIYHTLPKTA